jgi:hypothetical protein
MVEVMTMMTGITHELRSTIPTRDDRLRDALRDMAQSQQGLPGRAAQSARMRSPEGRRLQELVARARAAMESAK